MPQFLFMESNVILAAFLAQHNVTSLQFKCRLVEEYKTKRETSVFILFLFYFPYFFLFTSHFFPFTTTTHLFKKENEFGEDFPIVR